MAIACLITYWIMTDVLSRFVDKPTDFLGGMWAVVATVFVFRDTRAGCLSAGIARMIATCISFVLCFIYLCLFPFTPMGMAALLGIGTVIMMLLGRRDDIVTTGITATVVIVVAAMSPQDAWLERCCVSSTLRLGSRSVLAASGSARFCFLASLEE
jgi:uncharacterized membrane protein YgaE (UPF0421/DUF939 family)